MCFGGYSEVADSASESRKRSSWLSSKIHRIKKMVRPVVELLHKGQHHQQKAAFPAGFDDSSCVDYRAEENDNNANEALESQLACSPCPCCCPCRGVVFVPLAWAAPDADICFGDGGLTITSAQHAEQQSPCYAY